MTVPSPDESTVQAWMRALSNWSRWGPDDELGTLNYITPERRRRAASLVREGVAVSCARPVRYDEPDIVHRHAPLSHFMLSSGEAAREDGSDSASDAFVIGTHGLTLTHLDALCHISWRGQMYNGRPARLVTARQGATTLAIDALADGVVARGVLLDIPPTRGKEWLDFVEPICPADLEAAERRQGVRVEAGDVLFVRTGYLKRRAIEGAAPIDLSAIRYPGLQAACLPWLHERRVALLGGDTANDVRPSGYARLPNPIHEVGLVAMGLMLLCQASFEDLASACARFGRWEFQLVIGPLKLQYGTGSPVNPIAIF
jgi:kynurenine formamidase